MVILMGYVWLICIFYGDCCVYKLCIVNDFNGDLMAILWWIK
jgi:hypothetical protein